MPGGSSAESLLPISVWLRAFSREESGGFSTTFPQVSYKRAMLAKRSTKATTPRPRYVTDRQGKRTGVVLSLKRYSRLMEDLHDLAVVAERRPEKAMSADDLRKRLQKRGLV